MSMNTSIDDNNQSRNVSKAILELRQAIVVSVLKRKHGLDGQLDGCGG